MSKFVLFSAVSTALVLFAGCASQAPPSGGPPDRIPPFVVQTIPADDSVAVGVDTQIEILFSEAMDRESVERSIFLSPRPDKELELKWSGRRLRIANPDLVPNRTYRVSVGAESSDEYRNKLSASYDFVFSTGEQIHRGEVTGSIQGIARAPVFVLGYDLAESPAPGHLDRAPYVTQAGDGGQFTFPGLAPGTFRVFAFEDTDQDQAHDFGVERMAVPAMDVVITQGGTTSLPALRLAVRDTVGPRVLSARAVDSGRIRIRTDEAVTVPFGIKMRSSDADLEVVDLFLDPSGSTTVNVRTGRQKEGVEYAVTVEGMKDQRGNLSSQDTTLTFKGDGRRDQRAPSVVSIEPKPGSRVRSNAQIVLTFSEAMVDRTPVWSRSDTTAAPAGQWQWTRPNVLRFEPEAEFPFGQVDLRIAKSQFSDVAENPITADVTLSFEAIDPRDLGILTGVLVPDSSNVVVVATPLGEGESATTRVTPGDTTYVIDDMIPGQYRLGGFMDRNDNGEWDPGTWTPFSPAEPVFSGADTVEVRERWETVMERPLNARVTKTEPQP